MSAGDVVCTGWLIKSPPEKKLKRYAWRKRWFVLRRGRMCGNPDVLEYYRSRNSKKPIRTIDLKECEVQMQTERCFERREFLNQYLFVVKTLSRVFYLVAKTEEEMNSWVYSIGQICHFGPIDDGTESEEGCPHTPNSQQPDVSPHVDNNDFIPNANISREIHIDSEYSLPIDYLFLSNCVTGRASFSRCDSFSNSERSLEQNSSDNFAEDVFLSPIATNPSPSPFPVIGPSPSPITGPSPSPFPVIGPSPSPITGPSPSPFPFLGPSNPSFSTQHVPTSLDRSCDLSSSSSSPLIFQHIPNIFQFDKPYSSNTLEVNIDGQTPPPLPPKPLHLSESRADEASQHVPLTGSIVRPTGQPVSMSRRISLSGLDSIRREETDGIAARTWNKRHSLNLHQISANSSSNSHEDSYVPMASPPISALDDATDGYIPMSPTPALSPPTPTPLLGLPEDLEPPPINRDLKPRRRARPPPLDLSGLSTIRESPTLLPLTKTLIEPGNSLHCLPVERSQRQEPEGITEDQDGSSSSIESKQFCFPKNEDSAHPRLHPRRSNLDYLSLDFNSVSPSPVQKKQFLVDEHRVDYVRVDEKKTQALQNTKMEWTDVRQSKV